MHYRFHLQPFQPFHPFHPSIHPPTHPSIHPFPSSPFIHSSPPPPFFFHPFILSIHPPFHNSLTYIHTHIPTSQIPLPIPPLVPLSQHLVRSLPLFPASPPLFISPAENPQSSPRKRERGAISTTYIFIHRFIHPSIYSFIHSFVRPSIYTSIQ